MATTINSYSVKLGMDAAGFIDSTKLSRSEARGLIKEIEGAQTPMEKFATQQERWQKQLQSGAIDQGVYNRLIAANAPAAASASAALGPLALAVGAVAAATTAAAAGGAAFISWARSTQNRIDDMADAAERAGLSFSQLGALKFGFAEGSGVDGGTIEASVMKLQANMAKAVEGDDTLRAAFAKLGLDAGQLMGEGPQQAILAIADKMTLVDTHAERLKLSMDLFGKSGGELASTLGKGSEALREAFEFQQKWASLTDQQVAGVGLLNDSIGRISTIIDGTANKVAAELAPAFSLVTDYILDGAKGIEGIDQYIKNAVTTSVVFVGILQDAMDITDEIAARFHAIGQLDFGKLLNPIQDDTFTFDKSNKLLAQLEQNREKARLAGIEAAERREAEKHAKELEETEKIKAEKLKAIDEAAKDEARRQKEFEREQNRMAENALKAAEQKFEKEVERQRKLQEDVAKGPQTLEVGSADYARFLAQQANTAMAQSTTMGPEPKTDEELLIETRKQLAFMQEDARIKDQLLRKIADEIRDNGWEAVKG